jgi:hypothetical protein
MLEEQNLLSIPTQNEINEKFKWACFNGDLSTVKSLLTDPVMPADIHYMGGIGLLSAADKGHRNIIYFLLGSEKIKEHANFHDSYSEAFFNLYHKKHFKLLFSVIFDLKLLLTPHLEKILIDWSDDVNIKKCLSLFRYNQLQQNLPNKSFTTNKFKI